MRAWLVMVVVGGCAANTQPRVSQRPTAKPLLVSSSPTRGASMTGPPSAKEVIARMAETYRTATAYSDRGDEVNDFGTFKHRRTFTTAFLRPDRFHFEYLDRGDPDRAYEIWRNAEGVFSKWYLHPADVNSAPNLGAAIGAAMGVSSGTSYTIPALLMPEVGGDTLASVENVAVAGTETLSGHDCWRLTAHSHGDAITMWVDRDSHLVRRVFNHSHVAASNGVSAFDVDETTNYEPVLAATSEQLAGPDLHGTTPTKYVEPLWAGLEMHFPSAEIVRVVPGGPADRAGMRVGDLVVKVDGQLVADDRDFVRALEKVVLGSTMGIVVARAGAEFSFVLQPTRRPDPSSVIQNMVGAPAPEATLGSIKLSGLKGHVVVLDFWATWCKPCKLSVPYLNSWHETFDARGLRVFGISSDDANDIAKYGSDNKIRYPLVHDADNKIAGDYFVEGLPMLVVIDKAGIVRDIELGAGNFDATEARVIDLLK